jgi:mutator protein MutT
LLITQRRPDDHLAGLWEFPGGKRESTETFEECLVRELREELRIEVNVLEMLEAVVHEYPERKVSIRFYRCDWVSGEPLAVGCQDFKWVAANELSRFQFPEADAQLVARLQSGTGFSGTRRNYFPS